jgi:hypothetical protein
LPTRTTPPASARARWRRYRSCCSTTSTSTHGHSTRTGCRHWQPSHRRRTRQHLQQGALVLDAAGSHGQPEEDSVWHHHGEGGRRCSSFFSITSTPSYRMLDCTSFCGLLR